jgi:hypothetical protein
MRNTWQHNGTMNNSWQQNHYNKQPNNTKLTQIRHQPNFTWNRALQTIYGEIQVSCRMKNDKQAWLSNEKHMTTQSLQQATKNTRLTQFHKQPKLTWNCVCQTIAVERQPSCRMKSVKQAWEYNEKHTIITTSNQTTLDLLNFISNSTSLGIMLVKLFTERSK